MKQDQRFEIILNMWWVVNRTTMHNGMNKDEENK